MKETRMTPSYAANLVANSGNTIYSLLIPLLRFPHKSYGENRNLSMHVLCICSLIIDNERWKQADVPVEFQELVDHIMANGR